MAKILLDYFFKITTIEPTSAASTAFLKQVCLVVQKKVGVTAGNIVACTSMSAVTALTDNGEAQYLFNAGMSKVYILPVDDLYLADFLDGIGDFFTILISSDFDKNAVDATVASLTKSSYLIFTSKLDGSKGNAISITLANTASAGAETVSVSGKAITIGIDDGVSTLTQVKAAVLANAAASALVSVSITAGHETATCAAATVASLAGGDGLFLGTFEGVTGVSETDDSWLTTQAAIANRCAFHTSGSNGAKNLCFAIGSLLSNALDWLNQQYVTMPFADDVVTVGAADSYFDDKISFVISDDEFGQRLALLVAGGKAITAPYIKKNLELDLQSAALTYVSGNEPDYSHTQAALLEDELQAVVNSYVEDKAWIEAGTAEVKLQQDNFVASGFFNIAEPKALWRITGEMKQTL